MAKSNGQSAQKISRSEAIDKLKDLRQQAAASRFGDGQMFRVTFVTRGDEKTPPYLRNMVCRYQVTQHLSGGQQGYTPDDHALIGVYEMTTRARALKLFTGKAGHEVAELTPQAVTSEEAAREAESKVPASEEAARVAESALSSASSATYATKKAKEDAERPLKAAKKDADKALKSAREAAEKARKNADKLAAKLADAKLAKEKPLESLTATISARIERLTGERDAATDGEQREAIQKKIDREQAFLSDPVKSLLRRYREINLLGVTELKVKGQVYMVTTPPVPALPVGK